MKFRWVGWLGAGIGAWGWSMTALALDLSTKVVSEISVEGNRTLAGEDILGWIKVKPGSPAGELRLVLDRDLKEIWKTGKFENLSFSLLPLSDGSVRLVLRVEEKPLIKEIQIEGNQALTQKELLEKSELKTGTFYDESVGQQAAKKINDYYREKEFFQAETEVMAKKKENQISLVLKIREGIKVKVVKIQLVGNQAFPESKIKGLMDTKEPGWFVGGTYKEETFFTDLKKILAAYAKEGYLKATLFGSSLADLDLNRKAILEKALAVDKAKGEMTIRLEISEGSQFRIGAFSVKGNIIYSEEELLTRMDLKSGQIMDRVAFEKDLYQIHMAYTEKGYIYADITPELEYQDDAGRVNVILRVNEGTIARVESIEIRGNTMTKEKVIRRELTVNAGEPFHSRKIQQSRERLMNLGFFQDVKVTTEPGKTPTEQVLVFEVEERHTGTISLGAGYSSVDYLMGYLQLTQANLFGNGQSVSLQWEVGSLRQSWQMSFTEPWLFDTPVSFGVDVWDINKAYGYNGQQYALLSQGGDIRLGKRFDEYWKGFLTYKLESDDYSDIHYSQLDSTTVGITPGRTDTSSVTPTLIYDTRDNIFDASTGMYEKLAIELAGGVLGGDNNYIKYTFDTSYFMPLIWKLVLALHANLGYGDGYAYGVTGFTDLPPNQRFRVGGTDTIRGYGEGVFGNMFPGGGGRAMSVFNAELHYPIIGPLRGVTFLDAGNAWQYVRDISANPYLAKGVGTGIRLTIPGTVILIRFDLGYPLDPDPSGRAKSLNYHFNIGNIF